MKYSNLVTALVATLLLGFGPAASAADQDEPAQQAKETAEQNQLKAEYENALSEAERQRLAAEDAIGKAREQLRLATEQRHAASRDNATADSARQAEMESMHRELEQSRRELRNASRELARVNRELARARMDDKSVKNANRASHRPVIGVILGDANEVGVQILGVSPDGPAERAGVRKDDIIVAIGEHKLAADEAGRPNRKLKNALKEMKANEPLVITLRRGDKNMDIEVTPEVREPLAWQSVTRFPTAPSAPGKPEKVMIIERIEVPEIDSAELAQQIEQMQHEVEQRRILITTGPDGEQEQEIEIEMHEMSELGDFALHDANVWFGLPMTRGLKLAAISDPALGEYFKTDHGVLVLKAKPDNILQLKAGDVILRVDGTKVRSPADCMRALRGIEAGDEFKVAIKRKRKHQSLKAVMPEGRTSFLPPKHRKPPKVKIVKRVN